MTITVGVTAVGGGVGQAVRGPINLQGRMTEEGVRFFEVNPRFTGLTGVRASLGYREVDAAIWAFFLDQPTTARSCLSVSTGYKVALRHVEETVMPIERVVALQSERPSGTRTEIRPECVMVTGASGYVGSNLLQALLAIPHIQEVRALVRTDEARQRLVALVDEPARLNVVQGALPEIGWSLEDVDIVVHLAAVRPTCVSPEKSVPFFIVNVEGTRRLLAAMSMANVPRMIYISSQAIYGASVSPPWSEMMTPAPQTSYGLSKWMGELLCRGAGVETIILRLARVYGLGSSMRWDELPHRFARLVAHGSSLPIYHGGKQRMDLIHIRDVSESIVRTLSLPLRGSQSLVLNIGSGNPVSVGGLARLCQQLARDFKWAIPTFEERKTDTFTAPSFGMDIRRAAGWLGWKPEVDLLSGMAELMKASDVEKQI